MKNIIYSCFNKRDQAYVDYLQLFLDEAHNYETSFKVTGILKDPEKKYFEYIINSFNSSGSTPSQNLFEMVFPEVAGQFENVKEIPVNDLRVYIFNLIDARVNSYIHDRLDELNRKVKSEGITSEITDEFNRLQGLSNRNKAKEVKLSINGREEYERLKSRPHGLLTGIKEVDEKIGGIDAGNVTTIAGFTSQFKTTFALNIAHLNAYHSGYNIAYISLETPKEDMYWNLLSLHSYDTKFPKFNFVGHDKMRWTTMTPEESDFIFNEVEPDLTADYEGRDGKMHKRGRIIFLDESDFKSFSFGEITAVLEKVDDELDHQLDAVIVDYIQLCKFSGSGMAYDANSQINSYVTFFRRLAQNFRKEIDQDGNENVRRLSMILLAQLNRAGWLKASRNGGKYDITALADANELERGSARILTTYTTEDLKARKSAQVQILKNRTGQTMYDPVSVYADGECYVFMDEDANAGSTFGSGTMDGTASIASVMEDIDNFDFGIDGL